MKKNRITLLTVLISTFYLHFSTTGQSIQVLGPNYFVAGIPSIAFYQVAEVAGRQRCDEWCWAASSQMVLNYYGLFVTQEQIVTKIFGTLECAPGSDEDIINALTGWAPDTRGGYSAVYSEGGIINAADIVRTLSNSCPLIITLGNPDGSGHAVVMTAAYYSLDQWGNPIISKVVIRDPWPYNPSRQEMSGIELANRLRNVFHIWVVRL